MDPVHIERLFEPYRLQGGLIDRSRLTCLTYVITTSSLSLSGFDQMLLIAATGATSIVKYPSDLAYFIRRTNEALANSTLHVPREIAIDGITSIEQLYALVGDDWRVELLNDKRAAEARLMRKHVVIHEATALGSFYEVQTNKTAILRVLVYDQDMTSLMQTAHAISRALGIGVNELVFISSSGEVLYPPDRPAVMTRSVHEGIKHIRLIPRTLPLSEDVLQVCARRAVSGKYSQIKPLSVGEKSGRIPSTLPEAVIARTIQDVTNRGLNRVVSSLTGITDTPLIYEATDVGGNCMELFQLMVACLRTGLPGVFSIEHRAHNIGDYFERVLGPSLALIGNMTTLLPELHQQRADHMTGADLFATLNVQLTPPLAALSHLPVGNFYRAVHEYLVRRVCQILRLAVRVAVVDAETLFSEATPLLTLGEAVDLIRSELDERVIANVYEHGRQRQIYTSDIDRSRQWERVCTFLQGTQAWPGGALTYLLLAALSHHGPTILNLKDSRLGDVARASLTSIHLMGGVNHAQIAVSGVTRCYPIGREAHTGDNVDPVIFAMMLDQYPTEMAELIRSMMASWIFPVTPENAGLVQVFWLGSRGRWFSTRYLDSAGGQRP
ncbi:hypothetical protein HGA91_04920 [candidate division WWE3 bacterium]|nr:hypothetical protein [candidate division WWE3 bacterium]